jgi:ubiquinone/menaquinone biosynthesis C-methylase UbiE
MREGKISIGTETGLPQEEIGVIGTRELYKNTPSRIGVRTASGKHAETDLEDPLKLEGKKQYAIAMHATNSYDRGFTHYQRVFSLGEPTSLNGKRILDVGASYGPFAEEAAGYGAKVVRVDPVYREEPPDDPTGAVNALAQRMPFQDNSFDLVLASYTTTWTSLQDHERILEEMLRVTKDHGRVSIYPVNQYKLGKQGDEFDPTLVKVDSVSEQDGLMPFEVVHFTKDMDKIGDMDAFLERITANIRL